VHEVIELLFGVMSRVSGGMGQYAAKERAGFGDF